MVETWSPTKGLDRQPLHSRASISLGRSCRASREAGADRKTAPAFSVVSGAGQHPEGAVLWRRRWCQGLDRRGVLPDPWERERWTICRGRHRGRRGRLTRGEDFARPTETSREAPSWPRQVADQERSRRPAVLGLPAVVGSAQEDHVVDRCPALAPEGPTRPDVVVFGSPEARPGQAGPRTDTRPVPGRHRAPDATLVGVRAGRGRE